MNKGMICISVCAETADEMIANIRRAEEFADVIEVRFDCLRKSEFDNEQFESARQVHRRIVEATDQTPLITTFRPASQGGQRELTESERGNFWAAGCETEFGDFEKDQIDNSWSWLWGTRICSFHDFRGIPANLPGIFQDLLCTGRDEAADVVKVAVRADDITDAISVWKLIEKARSAGKGIIPIAMGEAGKWTRILGLAHGAVLTYASLEAGFETAEGQITAKDMIEIYRVKELDLNTKVYGVIGDPVSQSLSTYMHNPAFVAAGVNAVFMPLLVTDIDEFMRRMVKRDTREVELNFGGFSVTMPHKQSIIKHLDAIDPTAEKIGAVNTVKIDDGRLTGYNTDAHGFIESLKERFRDLKSARVAIFGAGGAARACVFGLKQEGADVTVFARDPEKAKAFADEFGIRSSEMATDNQLPPGYDIVVDATPLGMKGPLENDSLFTGEQLDGVKFVYDLVTRPDDSGIIREAKKAGIPAIGGLEMLVAQGAKQFEIWTGQTAPVNKMKGSVLARIKQIQK